MSDTKIKVLLDQLAESNETVRAFQRSFRSSPVTLPVTDELLTHPEFYFVVGMLKPMQPLTKPDWWPHENGVAFLDVDIEGHEGTPTLVVDGCGFIGKDRCVLNYEGPINKRFGRAHLVKERIKGQTESGVPLLRGHSNSRPLWKQLFKAAGCLA